MDVSLKKAPARPLLVLMGGNATGNKALKDQAWSDWSDAKTNMVLMYNKLLAFRSFCPAYA